MFEVVNKATDHNFVLLLLVHISPSYANKDYIPLWTFSLNIQLPAFIDVLQ